jgi:hypothetical protein
LEKIIRRLSIPDQDSVRITLRQLVLQVAFSRYRKLQLAAALLAWRPDGPPMSHSAPLMALLANCLTPSDQDDRAVIELIGTLKQALGLSRPSAPSRDVAQRRPDQHPTSASQKTGNNLKVTEQDRDQPVEKSLDDVAWRIAPAPQSVDRHEPGLLADDAGLILLHPFIPVLFNNLGILSPETRTLPENSLPRAAALLHWLLTGEEEVYEFGLTLIKVLLGLATDAPLSVSSGLLTPNDRGEADALLAAAIEHWRALGKTSLAGLRASFLQRRGMLHEVDQGWQLRMEGKSFDVLLGQLPWGISIVKLPWITKPIFTDWPTS